MDREDYGIPHKYQPYIPSIYFEAPHIFQKYIPSVYFDEKEVPSEDWSDSKLYHDIIGVSSQELVKHDG